MKRLTKGMCLVSKVFRCLVYEKVKKVFCFVMLGLQGFEKKISSPSFLFQVTNVFYFFLQLRWIVLRTKLGKRQIRSWKGHWKQMLNRWKEKVRKIF